MQELITPARGPAREVTTPAHLAKVPISMSFDGVEDAIADLSELDYLINDLSEFAHADNEYLAASHTLSEKWLPTNFRQFIQILKFRHRRQLDLIERISRWDRSGEFISLLNDVRKEFIAIKSSLRVAYRQRGMMLCASDWQTPIYSASLSLGQNRLTDGIAEHSLDYKRDGHLDAAAYEANFLKEYTSHLGSDQLKAYLTNSGMAAFTTVLHWLAHEERFGTSFLALEPMYFENIHLVQSVFPHSVSLHSPTEDELLDSLRTEQPSVVLCDAVANCGQVMAHDIEQILNWARFEAKHNLAIVIDTTCLPLPLLPDKFLRDLPENVLVIFVESLAKHHQFGMDIVTGGIIVAHMQKHHHESFRKSRARLGTNISDSSVGSLPGPNRTQLTDRLQRHSKNIYRIAQGLTSKLAKHDGVIDSVSWLSQAPDFCQWYRGACLTIKLKKTFCSIETYQLFEKTVLDLCKQNDLPIALSTSFGFDVSRLYVTAPATRFEEPFLRASMGTETEYEINNLLAILEQASIQVRQNSLLKHDALATGKENSNQPKNTTKEQANIVVTTAHFNKNSNKTSVSSSVFTGDDALKNYLCPANYSPPPLVELPNDLNPFTQDGVRLFAKMVPLVPLMNIKSIPAFSMLNKAKERGELEGVKNIIESSSSNTVLSLSVIAKLFGIDNTCAIVDHSIAPSLVRMLRLFGIEIFLHPAAGHELFGVMEPRSQRAANYGAMPGWLNPGQYTNPDNPVGFAEWLAPDLWNQTNGRLSILSCGLGTCGTMVGLAQGLRKHSSQIKIIACCPEPGELVPGPREQSLLSDVSFTWQGIAESCVELKAKDSFAASVALLRKGILGGPSSGMNYAGALRYLGEKKKDGTLKHLLNSDGELWCVFVCCDSPLPHVDEYYEALGEEYFPVIHGVSESPEFQAAPQIISQAKAAPAIQPSAQEPIMVEAGATCSSDSISHSYVTNILEPLPLL